MNKIRECAQCGNKRSFPANRQLCSGCRTFNLRVKRGEVGDPDTTDLTTEGYKEPMKKVEGGFGFYGALTRSKDDGKLQCHMCGYLFVHLGAHIRMMHAISSREYKQKYGLRLGEGLVAPKERERLQKVYNEKLRIVAETALPIAWDAARRAREKGVKVGGDQWTAQLRNEKGYCKDQTLEKLRYMASLADGVITRKAATQMYGHGFVSVAEYWFGSFKEAVAAAGGMTGRQAVYATRLEGAEKTIACVKEFYEKHGRTPQYSDFNSDNGLPPYKWVTRTFGSLNEARREAGVPLLVKVSGNKWEERAV